LSFNGSSQILTTASSSNLAFGSGDYTVEAWIYTTSNPGIQVLFASGGTGTNNFYLSFTTSYIGVGTLAVYILQGSTTLSLNTWYHVAASRSSGTLKLFLNGSQIATGTDSTTWIQGGTPTVGSNAGAAQYFIGYMSNLRVLKGTALYTSAFTPSTIPLTPITNTQLLLNTVSGASLQDSSINAFAPTGTSNNPTWNQLSPFATGLGYKNRVYTFTGTGTITF
jgi:hypothetical protein